MVEFEFLLHKRGFLILQNYKGHLCCCWSYHALIVGPNRWSCQSLTIYALCTQETYLDVFDKWHSIWIVFFFLWSCSLRMYNSLVERCFSDCVNSFRRGRALTSKRRVSGVVPISSWSTPCVSEWDLQSSTKAQPHGTDQRLNLNK